MSDWREVRLKDIAARIQYGYTASASDSAIGPKFLRITDIVPSSIDWESVPYCPIDDKNAQKYHLHVGDIVIARTGNTTGYAKLIREDHDAVFASYLIRIQTDDRVAHSGFVGRLVESDTYKRFVLSRKGGAAQGNANAQVLTDFAFLLPPLHIQRRIADILSAYDDLIENNHRRIALLEEAARMIYQEWFVRLRFPGYETARIVDGVPEGWEKRQMQDVCDSVGGGTPSTSKREYWDSGDVIWVTPTDITKSDCLVLLDSEKKITERGLRNSSAKMLPAETILMTSRASVGFFGVIDREVCTNQGFISVIPYEEHCRMYLLHNLISRRDEIILRASGATYKEINKSTFREMPVILPSADVLHAFSNLAYTILQQVRVLKKQNQRLQQARHILLPKLMSGEICV